MIENENIYKGLECYCNEFEKIPIDKRDLGIAGIVSSYTLSIGGAVANYKTNEYLQTQEVSKGIRTLSSIKITANFGILGYLIKKVERKSDERAGTETAIETGASIIATKTGISLLTRIAMGAATGAAVGSAFPIVGTIIGAVAGTLIAGVINDTIFEEEDNKLESDKAYNAAINKQVEQYILKTNAINDYLIKNNYKELRILNENEAENLCKEASNLQSHYFKTIELMLSYKDYLSTDSTESTANPTQTSPLDSSISNLESSHIASKPPYCNPHPSNDKTIQFKLSILDYHTSKPLKEKQIQITNIDSKQTQNKPTNDKGEVIFDIPENERGDYFSIKLICNNDYEPYPYYLAKDSTKSAQDSTLHTTQKILTPNAYQSYPAELYFRKQQHNIIIGILKAYKTNKNFVVANNSYEAFVNMWQEEVFTIDNQQTLRIQAFLYDFDKDNQGDAKSNATDKNQTTYYKRNLTQEPQENLDQIKWYYQVLNSDISDSLNIKQNAKNLTPINQKGTNINFNLSMLKESQRKTAKRVRIFAYVGAEQEVIYANSIHLDTNTTKTTQNRIERIYCMELKIVESRFSLLFDGENLSLYENERLFYFNNKDCVWSARSGKAIDNIQAKEDKKFKTTQDRLCIKYNESQSFHYDTQFQSQEINGSQVIKESEENGCFYVKVAQNNESCLSIYKNPECTEFLGQINDKNFSLENKNINLGYDFEYFAHFIGALRQENEQDFIIPLRVEYKKRIIIAINRKSQTTQSTKAEFSMSVDNQMWEFKDSKGAITNTAYILERPGPDCITPNLELRIPSGRYNVKWNSNSKERFKNDTLALYNHYLPLKRAILIHNGIYPQNSQGCLLLEERIGEENKLERGDSIIEKLRNEFKSQAFKEKFGSMPNAASHIMVMVENEFETKKQIINNEIPPNVIRIETQDESEEFIEIILPPKDNEQESDWLSDTKDVVLDLVLMGISRKWGIKSKGVRGVKGVGNLNRSLTREEVLEVVERLPQNVKDWRRRVVKSKKELDELWEKLTKNAKELEPRADKIYGEPIHRRELDDKTVIQYKKASRSGGETIEINSQNPRENLRSIHIKQ